MKANQVGNPHGYPKNRLGNPGGIVYAQGDTPILFCHLVFSDTSLVPTRYWDHLVRVLHGTNIRPHSQIDSLPCVVHQAPSIWLIEEAHRNSVTESVAT